MSTQARTERQLAERHRAILRAARELAHDQGWDAVTTRRLADRIEYSQPVLYSHFPGGKDEMVTAVALDGFGELATVLRAAAQGTAAQGTAAQGTAGRRDRLRAVADAYLGFAREHPAVYDAMFTHRTGLAFAAADTPAPLREGFAALRAAVTDEARPDTEPDTEPDTAEPTDADLAAELAWATLHGLAALTRAGRLPTASAGARVERFAERFAAPPG